MCEYREEAKNKIDRLIIAMDRLSSALEARQGEELQNDLVRVTASERIALDAARHTA